jgi:hypothetical protein
MDVRHQVAEDFDRAQTKAFWRRIAARLLRRDNGLLSFEETRRQLRAQAQHYGGLRAVPIDSIVGSVSRYRDFDRAFLPRQARTRSRWLSIDRAYYEDSSLPPIELYKLGETYFVKDGNHRVSVAREQGQAFIDAHVIEVQAPVPVGGLAELENWIRDQDALEFASRTRLMQLRPEACLELTLCGQYEKLLEHIDVHRWFMGTELDRPVEWDEAVSSWYDEVYSCVVEAVRQTNMLRDFPGRTEADLYLWIIEHRWLLVQAGTLEPDTPIVDVARAYAAAYSPRLLRRIARLTSTRGQV